MEAMCGTESEAVKWRDVRYRERGYKMEAMSGTVGKAIWRRCPVLWERLKWRRPVLKGYAATRCERGHAGTERDDCDIMRVY